MKVDPKNCIIYTERLKLRCFKLDDINNLYKFWSNKDVMKYIPEGVYNYETIADIVPRIVKSYETVSIENFYAFSLLIELKDTAEVIGWCGVIRMFPFPDNIEVFVGLDKEYWGNSYAEEATREFLSYVFDYFDFNTITALVHPENKASRQILEKIGFQFERLLDNCPVPYQNHNGYMFYSISKNAYYDQSN